MIAMVIVGVCVVAVAGLTVREIATDGYHRVPTNTEFLDVRRQLLN